MGEIVLQLITAFVGSLGFSLIFNVEKKHLLPASIGGIISWGIYLLCAQTLGMGLMVATVISAACCEVYAEILARVCKCPTTLFYIPAVVPLIPGGSLYNTMYAAVFRDWEGFRNYGFQTLQVTLAISIGISFISGILYVITNHARKKAQT